MSESGKKVKNEIFETIGEAAAALQGFSGDVNFTFKENLADKVYEKNSVQYTGVLESPLAWLRKRIDKIDQKTCHVIVEPEKYQITLITEETDHFKNKIIGQLTLDPSFELFVINTEEFKSAKDWAALFKKHKYAFDTLTKANDLILNLLNYKAKVQQEVEKAKDAKGNVKDNYERTVTENNLPEEFEIKLPIFKGQKPIAIDVVFEVNDKDLSLSLWSDFVQIEMKKVRDDSIAEQIQEIETLAPDIVVFYK